MTWVKIDDGFFEHPKTLAVGEDAAFLFLAGLGYCNKNLTDGMIPKAMLRRLTRRPTRGLADRLCAVLVPGKGPYWHDRGDYYESHEYLAWNDSRATVLARRERDRKRKKDSERNPDGSREGFHAESEVDSDGPLHSAPLHSSPEDTPPLLPSVGEPPTGGPANGAGRVRTRRVRARLPDEWAPSDDAVAYGKSLGFSDADLERIADEFCTYWWGEGKPKADWDRTFENRLLQVKHGGKR